jgi:putative aldouronate transport system permease protein
MIIKKTLGERLFDILNYSFILFICIITLYPFAFVFFASLSTPEAVYQSGGILFYPKGFRLGAYGMVLENPMIGYSYLNTIFYVVMGTTINIILSSFAAYSLSRKWLYGRNLLMFLIVFTMYFSGGLIPTYLIVRWLGLVDNRMAMVLPNAIVAYYVIIMRTYFQTIPDSMEESAKIDGANDFTVLFRIMMPLAKPVVSVMVLFYAVMHWNSWFNALIYLRKRLLYPLQMILREILVQNAIQDMMTGLDEMDKVDMAPNIKYATIMVATLPILLVYPFLQKHFAKGIMIGAIKS